MQIEIISPEKSIFKGNVDAVNLPGAKGRFTILDKHAPIISLLEKGDIIYKIHDEEKRIPIESGFVELSNNIVTICIETLS